MNDDQVQPWPQYDPEHCRMIGWRVLEDGLMTIVYVQCDLGMRCNGAHVVNGPGGLFPEGPE